MQNAVDALKIAFAVLIFVIALSITFSSISQAKKASTFILTQIDKTNFYENLAPNENEMINGGRKVKIDTIISNLHRIPKESFEIKVVEGSTTYFTLNNGLNELNEAIKEFQNSHINTSYEYIETFSEVTFSGEIVTGDDGTSITAEPGIKKIYITYKKIN